MESIIILSEGLKSALININPYSFKGPPMRNTTVLIILTFLMFATWIWAPNGFADRVYIWTDEKGESHITQHPPPQKGTLQDVMDYTHESRAKKRPSSAQPEKDRQAAEKELFQDKEASRKRAIESVKRQDEAKALSNPQTCYLQAPDTDVWVRVYNANKYKERDEQLWSGKIEKHLQQLITAKGKWIIFDYRTEPKGPFQNESVRTCSGGGVIRLVR